MKTRSNDIHKDAAAAAGAAAAAASAVASAVSIHYVLLE